MKITINQTLYEIFEGAKVKDALRKYCATNGLDIHCNYEIYDSFGNKILPDGSLSANDAITIKK